MFIVPSIKYSPNAVHVFLPAYLFSELFECRLVGKQPSYLDSAIISCDYLSSYSAFFFLSV